MLVGVLGLAIGAVIASAFPKTRIEEEMIGEQAGTIKQKVGEFVSDQAENLGEVASRTIEAVKDEAKTQGLTPAALKEGVAAVREKATKAASGAPPHRPGPALKLCWHRLSGTSTHIRRYSTTVIVLCPAYQALRDCPKRKARSPPCGPFGFSAHHPR